jgi:hypothetical protein
MEEFNEENLKKWIIAFLYFFASGLVIMWLWNWVGTDLLSLPEINYFQSLGLLMLSNLLIKR